MDKSVRCDASACGAEALAKVRSELTLNELHFCGHHLNKNSEALTVARFYVVSRKVLETA